MKYGVVVKIGPNLPATWKQTSTELNPIYLGINKKNQVEYNFNLKEIIIYMVVNFLLKVEYFQIEILDQHL
jgi:hypothetical protein